MLNTKKYLYILPDAAYIAELLPTKKPHSFAIQAFRQINGTFLDENEFLSDNIDKLIKKIEPEEYQLILPDFLFTNTIVDIAETSEADVKKYLVEKLLPSLDLSKETHEIDTFILTQHQGKFKVQLSALEKSLLAPLQKACEEQKIKITHISPLSWTIKSAISLEPSISTIQIGSMLYLALHYIGVDQTISYSIQETANVMETVKTLKGGEPNIQTMYLLTNQLIENEIKEHLSGTLPIQQLANFAEEQEGIPAYMKQIIEAGAKTFDIAEYPVPKFPLGKFDPSTPHIATATTEKAEEKEAAAVLPIVTETPTLKLPEPTAPSLPTPPVLPAPIAAAPIAVAAPLSAVKKLDISDKTEAPSAPVVPPAPVAAKPVSAPAPVIATPIVTPPHSAPNVLPLTQSTLKPGVPMINTPLSSSSSIGMSSAPAAPSMPGLGSQPPRMVIKNKSNSMVKVVAITLGALLATVALGVAIGFGVLSLSDKKNVLDHNPVVQTSPSPAATQAPSPTPVVVSPSPVASGSAGLQTDKTKMKILVVNATKTAGKAGGVKTTLLSAGYKNIDTGNAKGTYTGQSSDMLLLAQSNATLVTQLSKDSKLTLSAGSSSDKSTEDPNNKYDAVIVLTQ